MTDVPPHLEQEIQPLLEFLARCPSTTRILQIRSGMPLLLKHLHGIGFVHLFATEDSHAQKGIVEAAREFCRVTYTPVTIFDVHTAERESYRRIHESQAPFDVIASFGAPNHFLFPVVYDLLSEGGVFVSESHFLDVPPEFSSHFRTLASHRELGTRVRDGFRAGGAVGIFQRIG